MLKVNWTENNNKILQVIKNIDNPNYTKMTI